MWVWCFAPTASGEVFMAYIKSDVYIVSIFVFFGSWFSYNRRRKYIIDISI